MRRSIPPALVEDVRGFEAPKAVSGEAALLVPATDSEWGRSAVVVDPEGHRVEILR